MSTDTTYLERKTYKAELIEMRRVFQGLIEAGAQANAMNPRNKTAAAPAHPQQRRGYRARSQSQQQPSPSPQPSSQQDTERITGGSIDLRRKTNRPNVYTGLHYPAQIARWGTTFNNNSFVFEWKHLEAKDGITKTNHNIPERDLLVQQALAITVRLVLEGGYPEPEHEYITIQLRRLRKQNPKLFDNILPRSERTRFQQQQEDKLDSAIQIDPKPSTYTDLSTGGSIKQYQVRDSMLLPTHTNEKYFNTAFQELLDEAYRLDYNKKNAVVANIKFPINWYDIFGFDNLAGTQHRIILHRGDFIKYRDSKIGQINQIFSYQSMKDALPRMFIRISVAVSTDYKDPVVGLDIYRLTGKMIFIGLPALQSKKIWIVPVSTQAKDSFTAIGRGPALRDMTAGDEAVHVTWNVKWL